METTYTAEDYAQSYDLFCEYIDPGDVLNLTRESFYAETIERRIAWAIGVMFDNAAST